MDGIGRLGHDPPRGPSADWYTLPVCSELFVDDRYKMCHWPITGTSTGTVDQWDRLIGSVWERGVDDLIENPISGFVGVVVNC
ncbi:hypothetical protein evm_007945 [Chilo suppressalis]|nr:hypothetical protein evm_007945 [Chilo suppressalis]